MGIQCKRALLLPRRRPWLILVIGYQDGTIYGYMGYLVLLVRYRCFRGNEQQPLKNKGIFDSGCSRHMTGKNNFLTDYQDIDRGFVAFGGSARGGKITRKGKIRTDKLDFEDVFFVKELEFNLFSVSQMCDKKNSVLFTETECLVLSPDFKLLDASQVLLRVPRQSNMYSFDLKNVVPSGDLTWGNLVRGLLQRFLIMDLTCVLVRRKGNTGIMGSNHKTYCLVVTDDFSRTEFKNREMNEFSGLKGIKREFSIARTLQQNGVAERKNKTLIEAARTMLADSLLPTVFWAEVVNTACYVLNRVLLTKPHNKTPYELIIDRTTKNRFMRPLDVCYISRYLDPLQKKLMGRLNEDFLVGTVATWSSSREVYLACSTNSFNTVSTPVNVASAPRTSNDAGPLSISLGGSFSLNGNDLPDDPLMPDLEDTAEVQNTGIFSSAFDDKDLDTYNSLFADQVMGAEADFNNMEPSTIQYITHNDYALWGVIMNGDAPAIASASAGTEGPIPPKTGEQKLARKNELKAKSTLLLAIPDEHLLRVHGIKTMKILEQMITDDLEEMELKWAVGHAYNKVTIARECKAPRNQGNRNGDAPRRVVPVETPTNTLVVQDEIGGYD
ncbi:ribonuclease H-like domain-containing protein [Tanacetum coccineum]